MPICSSSQPRFRVPTPCSPVIVPPREMARSITSPNASSARATAAASARSNTTRGWKLPSPAWPMVAMSVLRFSATRSIPAIEVRHPRERHPDILDEDAAQLLDGRDGGPAGGHELGSLLFVRRRGHLVGTGLAAGVDHGGHLGHALRSPDVGLAHQERTAIGESHVELAFDRAHRGAVHQLQHGGVPHGGDRRRWHGPPARRRETSPPWWSARGAVAEGGAVLR